MTLLTVDGLRKRYPGADADAVRGISLSLEPGEVVSLLGPSGCGKTTTLRSISGLTPASQGKIVFAGEEITRVPAHEIVGRGIALAPEGRHCFPRMTVRENLDLGAHRRRGPEIAEDLARVYELFPVLKERTRQKAGTMSGGEQQMLAIGRALMARPSLLCMDEPSMGLAPRLVEEVFDIIRTINEQGTTIFVIEQNVNMALSIAHRGYVFQMGEVVLTGAAAELLENPLIQKAYLGGT